MLSSAQLCWAASVINLVCDYCQSQTPPPRTSALMGTMSPGAASQGGRDKTANGGIEAQAREKGCGEKKNIVGRGDEESLRGPGEKG